MFSWYALLDRKRAKEELVYQKVMIIVIKFDIAQKVLNQEMRAKERQSLRVLTGKPVSFGLDGKTLVEMSPGDVSRKTTCDWNNESC